MSYRGDDLDLRTTQTWSGGAVEAAGEAGANGQRTSYRTGPFLVDETVLACSNHAYDIALAHRAGEVRLEHLIYAMTRIDGAIDALEARGIRLSGLRRDVASIVASEIPVGLPNGKGSPRRSDEFADVLRLAAATASRRNMPATIDDVLNVMLDQRADISAGALLVRHVARAGVREAIDPLPPLTRYVSEPRYLRSAVEAPRYVFEPTRYRADVAATTADMQQNSRIEALEQMVRSLGGELASERQALSGLIRELSRETQAQRDDQGRLHSGLFERMQTLEQSLNQSRGTAATESLVEHLQSIEAGLELRLQEMSQSWSILSTRLQELESAVRQGGGAAVDLKPIAHRLDVIEEAVLSRDGNREGDLAERIRALESEFSRAASESARSFESLLMRFDDAAPAAGGLTNGEIQHLTASIASNTSKISSVSDDMSERLGAVERALGAEIETAAVKHNAYAQDLGEVHEALMKLNQNQHTLASSIDQWRTDAAGDIAMIANHVNALDRDGGRPGETMHALQAQMDTMSRLLVERYHRRNRFWYWLFGTDDWIGASWPSQAAALDAEKARIRSGKPSA